LAGIASFCLLLLDISDGGAEVAGDRIEVDFLARSAQELWHHTSHRFVRLRKGWESAIDFELVRRAWAVQKLIVERSAITHAFGRKLPPLLRTPPPGRMMYCISGWTVHHFVHWAWYITSTMVSPLRTG
jgi:hypothetical protein